MSLISRIFIFAIFISLPLIAVAQQEEASYDALIQQLSSESEESRVEAMLALSGAGTYAVHPLLNVYEKADLQLKVVILKTFGKMGEAARPAVNDIIANYKTQNISFRVQVIKTLGQIGSENVIEPLIEALKDPSNEVIIQVEKALGKLDIEIEPSLEAMQLALHNEDKHMRYAAAAKMLDRGSEAYTARHDLIDLLDDDYQYASSTAQEVLLKIGESVVPSLIEVIGDDENWRIAAGAETVLIDLGQVAVPLLIDSLHANNAVRRERAAYILGVVKSEEALTVLLNLLQDENAAVRISVVNALGRIGKEEAIGQLSLALSDSVSTVRTQAAYALGLIGSFQAVDALVPVLDDPDTLVQGTALQAFGAIGIEAGPAITRINRMLRSSNITLQKGAVKTLNQITQASIDLSNDQWLPQLQASLEVLPLRASPEIGKLRQRIAILAKLKEPSLLEWFDKNRTATGVLLVLPSLLFFWMIVLFLWPLQILKLNNKFDKMAEKAGWQGQLAHFIPAFILLRLFHYHRRVLDAWVRVLVPATGRMLDNRLDRLGPMLPTPLSLDEHYTSQLSAKNYQTAFANEICHLLITGASGSGKTRRMYQLAELAINTNPKKRLNPDHLMIPIFIEAARYRNKLANFDTQFNKQSAFLEEVHRQLDLQRGKSTRFDSALLRRLVNSGRIVLFYDSPMPMEQGSLCHIAKEDPIFNIPKLIMVNSRADTLPVSPTSILHCYPLAGDSLAVFVSQALKEVDLRNDFPDAEYYQFLANLTQMAEGKSLSVTVVLRYIEHMCQNHLDHSYIMPSSLLQLIEGAKRPSLLAKHETL